MAQRFAVAAVVPVFFTDDLKRALTYYERSLGFERQFEYGDPPFFAGAIRDGHSIFFRLVDEIEPSPKNKYSEELLDAYIQSEDVPTLFAEYKQAAVNFDRELDAMPWGFTEFVVRDCDGRLLCFGQDTSLIR